MAEAKTYLTPVSGSDLKHVFISYSCVTDDGKPTKYKYYPGIQVKKLKDGRVPSNVTNAAAINATLSKIKATIERVALEIKGENLVVTRSRLRERMERDQRQNERAEETRYVLPFLEKTVEHYLKKKKPNSAKVFRTLKNYLTDYEAINGRLTFADMGQPFFDEFVPFLRTKTPPLIDNSIVKYCKALKTVLYRAIDAKVTKEDAFKTADAGVSYSQPGLVYLSQTELEKIYALRSNADVLSRPDAPVILREIDRTVLESWLGLRHSDTSAVNQSNLFRQDGKQVLVIKTQKTGVWVTIPLHPIALEILARYDFNFPKISNQKANVYIKEVCQLAEITEPVQYKGATVPKYLAIGTHTCRRSFITNMLLRGFSALLISKITGQTLRTVEGYNRMSSADAARYIHSVGFEDTPMRVEKFA